MFNPIIFAMGENDKRFLLAFLLIFVLFFALIGYIGFLIVRFIRWQGTAVDQYMDNVLRTKVVTTRKHFIKLANKKNIRKFNKDSWIPMLLMSVGSLLLIIYCAVTGNWDVNLFDYKSEGIGTLFFIFDWENVPKADFFGMKIISGWPPLLQGPTPSVNAWGSYAFFPLFSVGLAWFMINVQGLIARFIRIHSKSKDMTKKSLDDHKLDAGPSEAQIDRAIQQLNKDL